MAAIWIFDKEGYLWCIISNILYLENDLKMMELPSLHTSVYNILFSPVVCEFSSLQISCESDFYRPEFKSCRCVMSAIIIVVGFFMRAGHLSRSVIVHLQWQYLK